MYILEFTSRDSRDAEHRIPTKVGSNVPGVILIQVNPRICNEEKYSNLMNRRVFLYLITKADLNTVSLQKFISDDDHFMTLMVGICFHIII